MKKRNILRVVLSTGWLAVAAALRITVWPIEGLDQLILELVSAVIPLVFSVVLIKLLGTVKIPQFDGPGSLVPLGATMLVIMVAQQLEAPLLVFYCGFFLMALPVLLPGTVNRRLASLVLVQMLVLINSPFFRLELYAGGLIMIVMICDSDEDFIIVRSMAANAIPFSYLMMCEEPDFTVLLLIGSLPQLILKIIGYVVLFVQVSTGLSTPITMAMHLLALAYPGSCGILFWILVFLGEVFRGYKKKKETDPYQDIRRYI